MKYQSYVYKIGLSFVLAPKWHQLGKDSSIS